MARTTTDRKDKTVKLRLSEELYKKVQSKGDNISETIRDMIRNSVPQKKSLEESGVKNNVPQISKEILVDIEEMCRLFKVSVEEFMKLLCEAMNEGKVAYEDGEIVVYSSEEIDLRRFKEACDAKGVDYQKMIDRATQNVWKS